MRKLTCKQVEQILATSRREDWPGDARAAIEKHLSECHRCRQFAAEMDLLSLALADTPREEVPEDFTSSVMARLAPAKPSQRVITVDRASAARSVWRRWAWQPAVVAALIVVVLFGAVVLVSLRHSRAVPTPAGHTGSVQIAAQAPSQAAEESFLEDLVRYHNSYGPNTAGVDAGVLMASSQL